MKTATPSPILRIENLGFSYPDQPAIAAGWSALIGPGVTLLHGDTGSGKSTLLRVLAGELPAAGTLTLAGKRLDADAKAYRHDVFFCDMSAEPFDTLTGHECTASLRAGDPDFDEARWLEFVDGFSLAPHLEKKMYMLSTGSRRKVGLAAALASGRALILLDEPTGALDAASIRCLWRALDGEASSGRRAVVIASGERVDAISLAGTIALPPE